MSHTFREVFTAKVTDVDDDEKRGRIRVTSRELVADGVELPDWVEPCFPYAAAKSGWFFVPPVDSIVEVEMVVGASDDDTPGLAAIVNPAFRWRCALYPSSSDVPDDFAKDYPQRMGIRTPGGNTILLDDKTKELTLKAGKIRLGAEDAAEPIVLGDVLLTMQGSILDAILAHFHPSGAGPTGTPDPASVILFEAVRTTHITGRDVVSAESFARK